MANLSKMKVSNSHNLSDLMFSVKKVETESITGIPSNSDYSHTIIGLTSDGEKHLNFCSNRYELVPVSTFAPQIRQIVINKGLKFTENYRMLNNSVFYGEMIIDDKNFYIGEKSDKLQMRLFWRHSYNGLENYTLDLGTFKRVLCSNGLWITKYDNENFGLSITGKHTQKIKISLEALTEKLTYVLENDVLETVIKTSFAPLYDNWVKNWQDRLIEVMNVSKIGTTKTNIELISNVIAKEANILYKGSVNNWLIYNGINSFMFNDANNNAYESKRQATDNKVLSTLLAM